VILPLTTRSRNHHLPAPLDVSNAFEMGQPRREGAKVNERSMVYVGCDFPAVREDRTGEGGDSGGGGEGWKQSRSLGTCG